MSDLERSVRIELPSDDGGFLQRACPHCDLLYAVHSEDYIEARLVNLRCPRCRFVEPFDNCATAAQLAFAEGHAHDEFNQMAEEVIGKHTRDLFSGLKSSKHVKVSGPTGRFGLPGTPVPSAFEDAPMSSQKCPDCSLRFKTADDDADACPACR